MKPSQTIVYVLLITSVFNSCQPSKKPDTPPSAIDSTVTGTYAFDKAFLKKHTREVLELQNDRGARVLLSADFQGRVMTSTATGDGGTSFGWINYELISSGERKKQFNPVGGEERFWIGPEGGQYSVYFKKGDPFTIEHWQVPPAIDTVAYKVHEVSNTHAVFNFSTTLTNYSGTTFDIAIERSVTLLSMEKIQEQLHSPIPEDVHVVAYETQNQIRNVGTEDWKKEKGLLSIWLLGMMTPSDQTIVLIPFTPSATSNDYITSNYFGSIPAERLTIKDSMLIFTCDGKFRSKLGLSPVIAKSMAASYDFQKNVLTLILFPVEKNGRYVNSTWEIQDHPYQGDVVNSYNDGPLADGSQLGPFYELESSSPAIELKKGEVQEYKQVTCHLQGSYSSMRAVISNLLHVDIEEFKK